MAYTEDTSDGPPIRCPGHDAFTACEDYPDGACSACNEREEQRLRALERENRSTR